MNDDAARSLCNSVVAGSVFIAFFAVIGLGLHVRPLLTYGHQFVWTLALLAFCVLRVLAIGMRIALKNDLHNKALGCVTQILLSAGVAVLVGQTLVTQTYVLTALVTQQFVVNIQMSRRFFCQLHPQHSKPVKYALTTTAYLVDPLVAIGSYATLPLIPPC